MKLLRTRGMLLICYPNCKVTIRVFIRINICSLRSQWHLLRHRVRWRLYESLNQMLLTLYPKGSPPHDVTIYKGNTGVALSRAFAMYFMHSPLATDLTAWFADTLAPEEYIWPTINHNAHLLAPGAYKGKCGEYHVIYG